jgi:hypothetical protein
VTSGVVVIGPPVLSTAPGVSSRTEAALATFLSTHKGLTLTAAQNTSLAAFLKTP